MLFGYHMVQSSLARVRSPLTPILEISWRTFLQIIRTHMPKMVQWFNGLFHPIITKSYNNKCNINHMREQMLENNRKGCLTKVCGDNINVLSALWFTVLCFSRSPGQTVCFVLFWFGFCLFVCLFVFFLFLFVCFFCIFLFFFFFLSFFLFSVTTKIFLIITFLSFFLFSVTTKIFLIITSKSVSQFQCHAIYSKTTIANRCRQLKFEVTQQKY